MLFPGTLTRDIASLLGYMLPLNIPSEGNLPFDPSTATVTDLRRLLKEETVSSAFLVEQYLAQIEEHNKKGTHIITTTSSKADSIEQARWLDDERTDGHIRGPMHGIPVLIEDNQGNQPKNNASLLDILAKAGIVIIGRTTPSPLINPKDDAQKLPRTASPATFLPITITHSIASPLAHLATSLGLYSMTPPTPSPNLPCGAIVSSPKDLALIMSVLTNTKPLSTSLSPPFRNSLEIRYLDPALLNLSNLNIILIFILRLRPAGNRIPRVAAAAGGYPVESVPPRIQDRHNGGGSFGIQVVARPREHGGGGGVLGV